MSARDWLAAVLAALVLAVVQELDAPALCHTDSECAAIAGNGDPE